MKKWKVLQKLKVDPPARLDSAKIAGEAGNRKLKIDKIIKILLANRGLKTKKEIDEFLNPKLEEVTIKNVGIDKKEVKKTIVRILKAIKNNETIIIYGDYDVDGISATAILWETIYSFYKNVKPYIPHRVDEGYGLSIKGIENLYVRNSQDKKSKTENRGLIITVDNGIVAREAVKFANKKEIDVIITDHHVTEKKLPKAYSIVHTTKLCGTGIAYLLSQEIKYQISKIKNNFEDNNHLELVALATVADLVPLVGANRTLLKFGLEAFKKTTRVGLLALFKEAGIEKEQIGVYEIGHIIAPRINAMGRISHGMDSLRLLCTKNPIKAKEYAGLLGLTNKDRQLLTEETAFIAKQISEKHIKSSKIVFVYDKEYNQGIIGLVASRLVEEFYRPSFVLSVGDIYAKGSARSIKGVNVIEMIRSVSHTLVQAGGHPMAAGFTLEVSKIEEFKKALHEKAEDLISDELLERTMSIDMPLDLGFISLSMYEGLQKLAPFGMGNPEPTFLSKNVVIEDIKVIGKEGKHSKMKLSQGKKPTFDAVAFGLGDQSNGLHIGDKIDIAYTIDENIWQGNKKLQLKVKDFKRLST